MQPTAQAVGKKRRKTKAPQGAKETGGQNRGHGGPGKLEHDVCNFETLKLHDCYRRAFSTRFTPFPVSTLSGAVVITD